MALLGVALLPVLGSVAASLSYTVIELAQEEVLDTALPTALAAQEIKAQVLELVVQADALNTAANPEDARRQMAVVRRGVATVQSLLRVIEAKSGPVTSTSRLDEALTAVAQTQEARFALAVERLELEQTFQRQHREAMESIAEILSALRPESIELSAQFIASGEALRRGLQDPTAADRLDALLQLEELIDGDIYAMQRVGEMQGRAKALQDGIDRLSLTAASGPVSDLEIQLSLTYRGLLRSSLEMRPGDSKQAVSSNLVRLSTLMSAEANIFQTRLQLISTDKALAQRVEESSQQSGVIAALTDALVAESGQSIDAASAAAQEAIDTSRIVLVFIAVVAFGASLAAIWFFVTRNIIRRLDKLTQTTRRLARGELEAEVHDPVADELGEMAQAISVFRDNAIKLRESQEALRLRQEEQRLIFDNVPARIWFKDDKNRILRLNAQAAAAMGMSVEQAEGADTYDLFPGIAAKYHEDDLKVIRSGKPLLGIVEEFLPANGTPGWVRTDKVPYTDPLTGEHYILVTANDITREKQAEQALEHSLDDLRQSNQQLQQFAYIASHDLQEPLRMVASYCDLLERRFADKLGDDGREFIAFATDGAKRMQSLINDLLQYSRAGNEEYKVQPFELDRVIESVRQDLKILIEERGAVIEATPLPKVIGDEGQIRLVLQNLVHNAIKFNKSEPPEVAVSARDCGRYWEIAVGDNGIGIDENYRERIFDVFQRLHTREEYTGTGIGLAIVRRIVERHRGKVSVAGKPGEGTVFTFTLPHQSMTF